MASLLVITNFPDEKQAQALAHRLVEKRLAACVNVMAPCCSIYRWKDAIESDHEIPVFIKCTERNYAEIEEVIQTMHPYELAEIIAVPVSKGLPAYLQWIADETVSTS